MVNQPLPHLVSPFRVLRFIAPYLGQVQRHPEGQWDLSLLLAGRLMVTLPLRYGTEAEWRRPTGHFVKATSPSPPLLAHSQTPNAVPSPLERGLNAPHLGHQQWGTTGDALLCPLQGALSKHPGLALPSPPLFP